MSDINIINGDGCYVKDAIDKSVETVIKYYGEQYREIVYDTVNDTLFYEWEDNQTEYDVMFDIMDGKIDYQDDFDDAFEVEGFYYLKINDNLEYDKIVVFRNKYLKYNYHSLIHELFGHGVFGQIDTFVNIDDKIYQRNGVSLLDFNDYIIYYEYINEGFVEDAVRNIMFMMNKQPHWTEYYFKPRGAAEVIRNLIGHDNLYKALILNDMNIESIYDKGSKFNEFSDLDLLLGMCSENGTYPYLNRKINDNLYRFKKRQLRKNNLVK